MMSDIKHPTRFQHSTWAVALLAVAFLFSQSDIAVAQQVTGSGNAGKVPKWTGSNPSSTLTDSGVTELNGNIGIGTANPLTTAHLYGTSGDVSLRIESGPGATRLDLYSTTGGSADRNWTLRPDWVVWGDLALFQSTFAGGDPVGGNIRFYIKNDGNVGIGTASPGHRLHVNGGRELISPIAEPFALGISRTDISGAFWLGASNSAFTPDLILSNNSGAERVRITDTGRVGIGTNAPSTSLHVVGTATITGAISTGTLNATGNVSTGPLTVSGAISAGSLNTTGAVSTGPLTVSGALSAGSLNTTGAVSTGPLTVSGALLTSTLNATGAVATGTLTVTGNITASGNISATGTIAAKYQDVAEWVPASRAISAGTVVVLDVEQSNHVLPSNRSYDTRVAGVVSANPGVILGEAGAGKVMVATTGRVKIKVDATAGPIRVGDLLVTSDKEGIAMKSQPLDLGGTPIHRPGTLIGKALEPLEKGVGEILALLSLQ